MIVDNLSIVLVAALVVITTVVVAELLILRTQLRKLLTGVRNSLDSGILELSSGMVNPQLQALSLFVRELLLKQREDRLAKNQYQILPQHTTSESDGPMSIIEGVKTRMLSTIAGLGDIVGCAILTGELSYLDVDSLTLRRGVVDKRIGLAITASAEEILFTGKPILENKSLISVEGLSSNVRSLKEIGVRSILLSKIQTLSGQLVLWIGVSKGLPALNSAEKERLWEISDAILQFMQLLSRMKQVLTDERESILGMSHDLRTPGITAMYVLNDLITSPDLMLSDEVVTKIGVAERCLRDQLNGITEFIRAGKVDNGAIKPNITQFEIRSVLLEILSLYELQALSRNVKFVASIPEPIIVKSDETLFRRIISNILSNVAKYSAPGSAKVAVTQIGSGIMICVENNIATIVSDNISNNNHSNLSSTGLGLRVAERLANVLGGEFIFDQVSASSVQSILRLDSVVVDHKIVKRGIIGDNCSERYSRVLIIDDDDATARMHSRYVQDIAREIDLADSIDKALSYVESYEYDLILSDIVFKTGPSVSSLLSHLSAIESSARVILISGSLADDILLLSDVPVLRLVKPISKPDLLDILEAEEIQSSNIRSNYSTI